MLVPPPPREVRWGLADPFATLLQGPSKPPPEEEEQSVTSLAIEGPTRHTELVQHAQALHGDEGLDGAG